MFLQFIINSASAQKESSIWYFGRYAGLDFKTSPPGVLTNGKINTPEGCAAIADGNGNLLFYTDGDTIWNSAHQVMRNGTDILGHPSSTQSGVIVPKPGNPNIYYVFTTDYNGEPNGLRYSTIDISADGGLGEVVKKNELLYSTTTEKITTVKHKNGIDIWVITHDWNSKRFRAFLITPSGLNTNPVISSIGSVHGSGMAAAIGCMKVSPDGKWLAVAIRDRGIAELFSFDKSTGRISNHILLRHSAQCKAYGIEFSADASKLYIGSYSGYNDIAQYNLNAGAGTPDDIRASATIIGKSYTIFIGALQLATNGKIYIARHRTNYLAAIEYPDSAGKACMFKDSAINLGSGQCELGLPTFSQSYFFEPKFRFSSTCVRESIQFSLKDTIDVDSVIWNFGDPASGILNTSKSISPFHIFSDTGYFTVKVTRFLKAKSDSAIDEIYILEAPKVDLGPDRILCDGNSILLDATNPAATYKWQDGSNKALYNITKEGIYWVEVSNGFCKVSDTIKITSFASVKNVLGPDTVYCPGNDHKLIATTPQSTYIWQDGSTDSFITVKSPGKYWVQLTNSCGVATDTISLKEGITPSVNLGNDTILCEGSALQYNVYSPGAVYRWQDGTSNSVYTITKTGTYWVELKNSCGMVTDTITVKYKQVPAIGFSSDTTLCYGESILLKPGIEDADYIWQDGTTAKEYEVTQPGIYHVNISNACGNISDTIHVVFEDCNCLMYMPNAFSPNGDTLNDVFIAPACRIQDFYFQVYNRWGQSLFRTDNIKEGWDGTVNGIPVPAGVYLYIIKATDMHQRKILRSGNFMLNWRSFDY